MLDKDQIVKTARRLVRQRFPDWTDRPGGCLFLAACTVAALKAHGKRAVLQAGTCYWPRLSPEQAAHGPEDVVTFGYEWEQHSPQTRFYIANNMLPEMHVWAGMPETQEVVDITAGEWPAQCKKILGLDWPGPKPPDYFWRMVNGVDWPVGVRYVADIRAIQLALLYLNFINFHP